LYFTVLKLHQNATSTINKSPFGHQDSTYSGKMRMEP